MKNFLFILLLFIFGITDAFAQNNANPFELLISSRVDTSSEEVMEVIALYENYFASQPDSIYDNPYWNSVEKKKYSDFDFSRASIFQGQMNPKRLFQYFSPFVMSVEQIGEKYQIRVLYSSSTTEPKYVGSKVWCIHKLNAIKENGKWVLENLFVEITERWQHRKVGFIEYHFPPKHNFDSLEAAQAEQFCADIIRRFNPGYNSSFKYYITDQLDQMGLLENFDYYFVGMTTGKSKEGMLLTARGSENYPHEFVHQLLPKNEKNSKVIGEGIAVFLGTRENEEEYEELMSKLAADLKRTPEKVNFKSVVSQKVVFSGYQTAYPAGAAICEMIYELEGDEGLLQLYTSNTATYESLLNAIKKVTGLNEATVINRWNKIVQSYNGQ